MDASPRVRHEINKSLEVYFNNKWVFFRLSLTNIIFPFPSNEENTNTKQECDVGAAKAVISPSNEEGAVFKDISAIRKEESCQDSCDNNDSYPNNVFGSADESGDTKKSEVNPSVAFPEPRLPYPCLSNVSSKDQVTYLGFLMSKKPMDSPQVVVYHSFLNPTITFCNFTLI